MKRRDLISGKSPGDYLVTGNFTNTGEYPVFCTIAGVVTTYRFLHRVQDASRATLKWSRGVLLTIWFSALHWGHMNRMTYPDLVPAISGFTELFFIEVFVLGILFGGRARSRGEIRSCIQEMLENSRK
jgi:hypothetical protein